MDGKVLFAQIIAKEKNMFTVRSLLKRGKNSFYEAEYDVLADGAEYNLQLISKSERRVEFKESILKMSWPSAASKRAAMCRRIYK